MQRNRLRGGAGGGVRWTYYRALRLLRSRGGIVTASMNTEQIQTMNADRADPDAMAELRALYLPVRYDDAPADREAEKRARAAYEALRRSPAQPRGDAAGK